ncbi:hypothetical protein AM1_0282 [Acaryochloris marina MBIC11017]|uniref:Uncharacterized protein n=1 Tax=Acaryochloris marina (strain MBIC 11017) TaxID=329726 RepID=B0C8X8_ACAM1|nr:hypothetical protein AM1_0282 [Acaryochloris marina MBIC11017]
MFISLRKDKIGFHGFFKDVFIYTEEIKMKKIQSECFQSS